ncbi:hypothetical protein M407DRAFT_24933 [Tulasnella calospora MUT 4182]|uniref:Uncharacterized protein n=1 Tax=Tulasnella calospora MUT 4182 TaxID=1051891 RepID=A0A0C3LWN9_9AGAM|nr:hypothetical protein M407DRAFT_24933 [Tulasnella calospora MUT 4182]
MDSAGQKSEPPSQSSSTISTSQSPSSSTNTSSSETLCGSSYAPGPEELKTIAALKKVIVDVSCISHFKLTDTSVIALTLAWSLVPALFPFKLFPCNYRAHVPLILFLSLHASQVQTHVS